MAAIGFHVTADRGPIRHRNVFVQNGPADGGAASNVAVVEHDGVLDERAAVYLHIAAEYGIANQSAREDTAARHYRADRLAGMPLFVERELGAGVGVAGRSDRPPTVMQIERRNQAAEIHVRFIIGLQGA
jgi:hypothetical protein